MLDGQRFRSREDISISNGLFDTVLVLAEFIETTEIQDVLTSGDWFDTLVLHPLHRWSLTESGLIGRHFVSEGGLSARVEGELHVAETPRAAS